MCSANGTTAAKGVMRTWWCSFRQNRNYFHHYQKRRWFRFAPNRNNQFRPRSETDYIWMSSESLLASYAVCQSFCTSASQHKCSQSGWLTLSLELWLADRCLTPSWQSKRLCSFERLPACLNICQPVQMFAILSEHLAAFLSERLPACLSVFIPFCVSTSLPKCLLSCLRVCQPVQVFAILSERLPA